MTVVQHTLTTPADKPVAGRTVACRLKGGGYVDADERQIIRTAYTVTDTDGGYQFDLTPNADIDPANTHYEVTHPGGETLTFVVTDSADPLWLRDLLVADPATPDPLIQGLPATSGASTGDVVTWQDGTAVWSAPSTTADTAWANITDKPTVIAAGDTKADARSAIGAGTSDLELGTTATTALAGDTAIPSQPSDIGAATSAQGALADTAVQPADLEPYAKTADLPAPPTFTNNGNGTTTITRS